MGGGLMQLVAYGAQDIYLTGNPQITFFKVVYRRHTNFSMECIEQTFNGSVAATASTVTATISRNGDLVSSMHLDVKFAAGMIGSTGAVSTQWTNNTGHAFVKEVEIEIGGQKIDKHYGQFLDIYNELTDHDEAEYCGLNKHKAKKAYLLNGKSGINPMDTLRTYIPLKFWFNRNPGLALPLIALQYHEVKVKLQTRGMIGLVNSTGQLAGTAAAPTECTLWVDYIYLDTDERRRFAQQSHEYLIEQLQREENTMSTSQKLNFNHPVKELIWVVQDDRAATENNSATSTTIDATEIGAGVVNTQNNDYFNYNTNITEDSEVINGQTSYESFQTAKLQLNGHDRFAERNASYFRLVQPAQAGHRVPEKHIYNYSFALKPEEHQPSGTCNFSRIDNAKLIFTTAGTLSGQGKETTLTVYAVNYNVLRIMSGMGGLAYSN
jgi:hypothetical protein